MTTAIKQSFLDIGTDPRSLDAGDESDGWYTPSHILDRARRVMGGIDCDPATCEAAQAVVGAALWYTSVENGLMQPWRGRVWLNPPYSAPTKWIDRALHFYRLGDVSHALILTNAYTETGWWQRLARDGCMLFFAGRLEFWHPDKVCGRNRNGQTLAYLGPNVDGFRAAFGDMGVVR